MNSFLKILGIIICILGCIFTNIVWIEVPILGEVKGLNNGAGIFSFGAFVIGAILYFISLFSDGRGIYWGTMILAIITLIAGFYYYQNVQTIIEKMTALSNISVFGMSVDNVTDNIEIIWRNGYRLSMFMGAVSTFISLVLLLSEEEKPQVHSTNNSNNQQNNSYSKSIQQTPIGNVSNFDNQPYIDKLKELFELNQNGVISHEIYEQEKSKIIEQQKTDKAKFEEREKEELLKQKSEISTSNISQNSQNKDRPSYISKPTPQKKTLDPNIIFVIVACLLLVGFAVYSLSSNKGNKSNHSENNIEQKDSSKVATNNKAEKKQKNKFKEMKPTSLNIQIIEVNSPIWKKYDGCSFAFSKSEKDYKKRKFLALGSLFGSDEDVIDLKINGKNEELFLKTKSENSYNLENDKFSCQITILNEKETGYESNSMTGEILIKNKNTGEEYSLDFYGGYGC